MSYKSYVPRNDAHFIEWADNLIKVSTTKCKEWLVASPITVVGDTLTEFKAAYAKTLDPNHGRNDTFVKNEKRQAAEAALRSYVQGFLARNPKVSDADRDLIRITVRDTTPTVVPPPTAQVEGELSFPGIALVAVQNIRSAGVKATDKSKHGVRIHYGVVGTPDETDRFRLTNRPATGADLPHSVFTRRKSHRFDFTGNSGREVFICMRYENSKGDTGPWGIMLNAFIP